MNRAQEHHTGSSVPRRISTVLVAGGVAGVSISCLAWGPLGAFCYAVGRCNSTFMWSGFLPMLGLVFLAFPVLPLWLARMARRWSRQTKSDQRISLLILAGLTVVVVATSLQFTGVGPTPFELFMRGFKRHMQARADVPAMRQWLRSLDPNDHREELAGAWDGRLERSEQPPAFARLRPKLMRLMSDGQGRLMVQLLWGTGMLGHWGILVGPEDMEVAEDSGYLYCEPLAPGAYIWGGP